MKNFSFICTRALEKKNVNISSRLHMCGGYFPVTRQVNFYLGLKPPVRQENSDPPSLPYLNASPPDHSSGHHSHHEENQADNDAHGEEEGLRRFCGGKGRGPHLRLES